jgi:hypothetical protein
MYLVKILFLNTKPKELMCKYALNEIDQWKYYNIFRGRNRDYYPVIDLEHSTPYKTSNRSTVPKYNPR